MGKTLLGLAATSLCVLTALSAFAHSPAYTYEGNFAGSMICESGEIGVLFHIEENGPITRGEFDRVNPRVNSVGRLISEEWIAKMRAEQERCRRPIGMSAYLSDRNQRAGSNSGVRYVYKKPFGCK